MTKIKSLVSIALLMALFIPNTVFAKPEFACIRIESRNGRSISA